MALRVLPAAARIARFAMNRRGMTSRFAEGPSSRVHVYDGEGGGKLPPIVMLHGLGSAGAAFAGVVAGIRPHVARVVIPELPGHGFSPHPGGDRKITPSFLLDAVTSSLEQTIDEPAIVFGSSLGGAMALKYAIHRPDRVRALFLVSPAGARITQDEQRELVRAFDVPGRREAQVFLERLYHRPPWFLSLLAREFPDLLRTPAVREILESATEEDAPRPEELNALTMPILLLWGRSEKLLPASALTYFRANLPGHAVIEEPEGFGHTPQLEVPKRVAQRVVEFARQL